MNAMQPSLDPDMLMVRVPRRREPIRCRGLSMCACVEGCGDRMWKSVNWLRKKENSKKHLRSIRQIVDVNMQKHKNASPDSLLLNLILSSEPNTTPADPG